MEEETFQQNGNITFPCIFYLYRRSSIFFFPWNLTRDSCGYKSLWRKWRCWKGYQAFLFIETVKNAILLILYKERTFLRMLQGEDDMSKACSCYFSPLAPTILFAASRLFLLPLWGQTRGESQRNDTSQNTQSTTIVTRLELQACSSIQA